MKLVGRPTLEMQAKHEAYVLDIAFKEFLSHGFKGTSLDAVAKRAKISRATLYRRYHGKVGLFLAVSEHAIERLHFGLRSIKTGGRRPPAVLEDFLFQAYEAATQPDIIAIVRMAIAEQRAFPDLALAISKKRAEFLEPMTTYITQLVNDGVIHLSESPRRAADHLMDVCLEIYTVLLEGFIESPRQKRKGIKKIVAFFLKGCEYAG